MRAMGLVVVLGPLAAQAVAGCSGGWWGGSSTVCTPGTTQACICPSGAQRDQECASDGSRWLSCDCGSGASEASGASGASEASPDRFVLVPAGTFTMGSPEDELGRWDYEDQHEVTLTQDFYLQQTEVTQAQWEALMGNHQDDAGCGGDCPVDDVNWWEALAYANALSAQQGLPACYTLEGCNGVSPGQGMGCSSVSVNAPGRNLYQCAGYRLPTEAEWEYAYRAGTTTAFYNGDIISAYDRDPHMDAIGWYYENSDYEKHPVGQKTPNAWGLYDMAGNVEEWCWDWYGRYPPYAVTDPSGPGSVSGLKRVQRGGSWVGSADRARAASRSYAYPHRRDNFESFSFVGFRLARSAL